MIDALSRLHPAAHDLLTTVDTTLARSGAPPSHPIWPLLRAAGLLPCDAVAQVALWMPVSLTARAEVLRRQRVRQTELAASLAAVSSATVTSSSVTSSSVIASGAMASGGAMSSGSALSSGGALSAAGGTLSGAAVSSGALSSGAAVSSAGWQGQAAEAFGSRLEMSRRDLAVAEESGAMLAARYEELAEWLASARKRLAHTLAGALRSAEAVSLRLESAYAATLGAYTPAAIGVHTSAAISVHTPAIISAHTPATLGAHTPATLGAHAPIANIRAHTAAAAIGVVVLEEVERFWQGAVEVGARARLDVTHAKRSQVAAAAHAETELRVDY